MANPTWRYFTNRFLISKSVLLGFTLIVSIRLPLNLFWPKKIIDMATAPSTDLLCNQYMYIRKRVIRTYLQNWFSVLIKSISQNELLQSTNNLFFVLTADNKNDRKQNKWKDAQFFPHALVYRSTTYVPIGKLYKIHLSIVINLKRNIFQLAVKSLSLFNTHRSQL